MKLTYKQTLTDKYLNDKVTTEVLFGGAAGGGKSAYGCFWILEQSLKFPNTRSLIGRKKLNILKQTTLNTFWQICKMQGIKPCHYKYKQDNEEITLFNGSVIILKDLFTYPSDPDFDNLGSLEITRAFIDEVNQISEKAKHIVKSRIRYKLDENNIIEKLFMSCNPAKNWVYENIFDLWRKGTLPENMKFIPALLKDNPHIYSRYRENLLTLDKASVERLLHGNWDYDDDPSVLIDYSAIADLYTNDFVVGKQRYISCDIALQGADKFVIFVWEGLKVIACKVIDKCNGAEVEGLIKETAHNYRVPQSNIVYDADGIGNFLGGYLRNAVSFHNGGTPIEIKGQKVDYANLKSQCYFELAKKINDREVFISCELGENKKQLNKELGAIKNATYGKDGKLAVLSKDKVKELLGGKSPDFSDALMMRMYFELQPKTIFIPDALKI